MTRLLKVTATALIIALAAFLFTSCGEETPTTKTSTKASTSKSKASAGAGGGSSTTMVENLIGQIITPTEQSPKDFTDSIKKRRPIVVLFYMTGPYDDTQVRSSVSTLESRYRGQVDFYTYLYSDSGRYMDLPMLLNVNTTPSLVIINKQATVQRAWTGFADNQSIEQGIVEATKT
ncbi:MAG: hypothetical protein WC828_07820 [Thermoleophilia bacterium]